MTVERKEPSLSDMGSVRDEPDVAAPRISSSTSRRQVAVAARAEYQDDAPSRHRQTPPPPPPRAEYQETGASRHRAAPVGAAPAPSPTPLLAVAVLLALIGICLAGFAYWQLMQVQQKAVLTEQRIVELEQRLALSDDEASQSVTTLQTNLRETRQQLAAAESEIRKLWDARNANRTAIGENTNQIAAAAKAAQAAGAAAAEAKKLAQAQEATLKTLSTNLALQTEQVGLLNDAVNVQKKQVQAASDKATSADTQIKQLKTDLGARVKRNEDAIQAIDAYRVSVNRDLTDIKSRLNAQ